MYYVTMQIAFHNPECARKERNLHCDIVHITTRPPFGSLDSIWIMRSQLSRRRDKGLLCNVQSLRIFSHKRSIYSPRAPIARQYKKMVVSPCNGHLYGAPFSHLFTELKISPIRLFANDVIIIGLVRADWPAPFSVTIGNPRADKLGRNGFECIVLRCSVDRERCVLTTFMHSAIENYSMLHLQRWMECRGIKRSGTKSLFMIISQSIMLVPATIGPML